MTQAKTGVFLSMGRLPQFVGQASVAASVLAGGASLLNAGGAHAAAVPGNSVNNRFSTTLTNNAAPDPGIGDIESPVAGNPAFGNFVAIEYDFLTSTGVESITNTSGTYTYSVSSLTGDRFLDYRLDYDTQLGTASDFSIAKTIYDRDPSLPGATVIGNTSSPTTTFSLTNQTLSTIWVVDNYSVTANGALDTVTNTFQQTPGPLPILGAGAAFGFSRKLRGRIKAARLS